MDKDIIMLRNKDQGEEMAQKKEERCSGGEMPGLCEWDHAPMVLLCQLSVSPHSFGVKRYKWEW